MNPIFSYIISRLGEPSTAAGIGIMVNAFQHKDYWAAIEAAAGMLAVLVPENWKPNAAPRRPF